MKINRAGIELIKRWESCRLTAYKDIVGVLTIGYGHTSMAGPPEVYAGMKITQTQAEEILAIDLFKYEWAVVKALDHIPNQNQFAAMTSLCYNIGQAGFTRSTVCKAFNAGKVAQSADAFRLWNKAGGKVVNGLVRRREAERALFLTPMDYQV